MKKRLSIGLLTFAFMLTTAATFAQPQRGGGDRPQRPESAEEMTEQVMNMMTKRLDLSDKQQKDISKVVMKHSEEQMKMFEQMRDNRDDQRRDAKEGREQMEKRQDEYKLEVMSFLSDKQKLDYAEIMAEMEKNRPNGPQQGGGPQGGGPQGGGPRR